MGILDELLGGGQHRKSTGISSIDTNKEIRPRVTPIKRFSNDMVLCHTPCRRTSTLRRQIEALDKLSPEQRAAFVKPLQERAAARGVTLPPQVAPEPKELGQVLTDLHGKPGQLRDILGGGDAQPQEQAQRSNPIIDMLGSPQAKAVLAGIAAMVVKRVMQGSSRTA